MNIKAKVNAQEVKAFRLSSEDIKGFCVQSRDIRKTISVIIDSITKLKDSLKPTITELDSALKSLPGKIKKIQEEIQNCETRLKDKEDELKSLERTLAATPKSIEIMLPNGKPKKIPNPEYYSIKSQIQAAKAEIAIIKSELYNLKTKLEYAKKLETRISAMKVSVENTLLTLDTKINRCRQIDNEVAEVFGLISKSSDSAIQNLKNIEGLIEQYLKKRMRYNDTYICPVVKDADRLMDIVNLLNQKKEKPSLFKRFVDVIKKEIKEEFAFESEEESENQAEENEPDEIQNEEEVIDNEDNFADEYEDDIENDNNKVVNNYYNIPVTNNNYNFTNNQYTNKTETVQEKCEEGINEESFETKDIKDENSIKNIYGYTDEDITMHGIVFDAQGHVEEFDGKSFGGKYHTYDYRLDHTSTSEYGYYTGERGESLFVPYENNAKGVMVKQILREYGLKGIEYRNAEPDFEECCEETVIIDNMCGDRDVNFPSADEACAKKWNACSKFGISDWDVEKVKRYRLEHWLTWHEKCDTKTMVMVRREINDYVKHLGGVAECKKRDNTPFGGYDE